METRSRRGARICRLNNDGGNETGKDRDAGGFGMGGTRGEARQEETVGKVHRCVREPARQVADVTAKRGKTVRWTSRVSGVGSSGSDGRQSMQPGGHGDTECEAEGEFLEERGGTRARTVGRQKGPVYLNMRANFTKNLNLKLVSQFAYRKTKKRLQDLMRCQFGLSEFIVVGRFFNNLTGGFEPVLFRTPRIEVPCHSGFHEPLEDCVFRAGSLDQLAAGLTQLCSRTSEGWRQRFDDTVWSPTVDGRSREFTAWMEQPVVESVSCILPNCLAIQNDQDDEGDLKGSIMESLAHGSMTARSLAVSTKVFDVGRIERAIKELIMSGEVELTNRHYQTSRKSMIRLLKTYVYKSLHPGASDTGADFFSAAESLGSEWHSAVEKLVDGENVDDNSAVLRSGERIWKRIKKFVSVMKTKLDT